MNKAGIILLLFFLCGSLLTAEECPECELLYAAANGQVETVKELISRGADVHAMCIVSLGTTGWQAERIVVDPMPEEKIKMALADGMAVWTALEAAAEFGEFEAAGVLLDSGADPNTIHVLTSAVRRGYTELVRLLLEKGVTEDNLYQAGRYAADYSDRQDTIPIMQLLIDHNLDLNKTGPRDTTILDYAIKEGTPEMVGFLKGKGALTFAEKSKPRPPSPGELKPMLGMWYQPLGLFSPGIPAKEIWNADGTGLLHEEFDDSANPIPFNFKVAAKMPAEPLFYVTVTFENGVFINSLIRISPDGAVREVQSFQAGLNRFPDAIEPGSRLYTRLYQSSAAAIDPAPIHGQRIDSRGESQKDLIGKVEYRADGTGAIYDMPSDSQPMAPFQYRLIWQFPESSEYLVVITYAPDNFWYLRMKISPDGKRMETDTSGMSVPVYPGLINPYSGFYGNLTRR